MASDFDAHWASYGVFGNGEYGRGRLERKVENLIRKKLDTLTESGKVTLTPSLYTKLLKEWFDAERKR